MGSLDNRCPHCSNGTQTAGMRFCVNCGSQLPSSPIAHALHPVPDSSIPSGYSPALINVMRLLAAGCMFSAMFAAWNYDFQESPGRLLVTSGWFVAMMGMLFVYSASKPKPPAWSSAVLAVFWVGLVALVIVWMAN